MLSDFFLKRLYPYEYVDDVFCIDYRKLMGLGIRGIIFDIDNTLVHHGDDSTEEIDGFIADLYEMGFKICFMSDNSEERVKRFLKNIDALYVSNAEKPKKSGFIEALRLIGVEKSEAVFIGDQVFLDIFGANRCLIPTVLVKFIRLEGEKDFGKRRKAEALILKKYSSSKKYNHRFGGIVKG